VTAATVWNADCHQSFGPWRTASAAASTAVPVHLKAKSEETGGAFLLFEDRMDHGKVTPIYIHPTL
jgi:hypothetical protein